MASVWSELKRRNVVKVAVAYAIVGWILIEISATVFPILKLPEWTVTFVTMLVLLGFPAALVLSWAYELTPGGLKPAHEIEQSESIAHLTGRKIDRLIIGFLIFAVGFLVVDNYVLEEDAQRMEVAEEQPEADIDDSVTDDVLLPTDEPREVLPNSVAVLPFDNLSPDQDDAYFATGIHEEILNQLAKLSALNVIARTSVLQYAGAQRPVSEIADELNVETVMEGTVRYADDRVRITTQLIDADTGAHLWSEAYERDFANIFAIQADIAMNIANALEAEFSLEEQESIEKQPTSSPAAYALYLQARDTRGTADTATIHNLLDRAIVLDPGFALAYAEKAILYTLSFVDTGGSLAVEAAERDELERIARENAEKALLLDPDLERAHGALGSIEFFHWRWTEAQKAYEKGNPDGGLNGWLNAYMGRRDEAIEVELRSVELDPTWWASHFFLGVTYAYLGEHEAAIESLRNSVDLVAAFPLAHLYLASMEIARGNRAAALDELQITEELRGENSIIGGLALIAYDYALIGRGDDAQRLFDEITEAAVDREVGAGAWAHAYLAIGDQESALEWLEVAAIKAENHQVEPSFNNLMEIKMNVQGDPVLEQPEFVALRNRLTGD
jgi:TolB-like protein